MICRLVKRELRYRFLRSPGKLLLVLSLAGLLMLRERGTMLYIRSLYPEIQISAGDLFITLFRGAPSYVPGENPVLNIPYDWLLFVMTLALMTANLTAQDLETTAPVILLQSRSRRAWAASRFFAGTILVTITFLLLIGSCLIGAVALGGTVSLLPTRYVVETLGMDISAQHIWRIVYLMPWCSLLAIAHLQLMVELVTSGVYGYMLVVVIVVVTCYCSGIYLPGNGAMLIRTVLKEGRIPMVPSMIVSGCMIVGSVGIGCGGFKRKDIV